MALRTRLPTLLLPLAVYLAGVALLGGWIIDDAGISFAYARNVAAGHGFVSQPGRVPVEGFSNFLWVVLLVPFFVVRLFDPVVTPKLLGAALVLGSFVIVERTLRKRTGSVYPGLIANLVLAASPPIVIWTASGLENGLSLFLLALLFEQLVERPPRFSLRAGALAALLAMTHPEGLIYLCAGPALAAIEIGSRLFRRAETPRRPAAILRESLEYTLSFAALFGPFMLFRLTVFGLPLPHTYYAKREHVSPWDRLAEMGRAPGAVLDKLADLLRGTFGAPGPFLAALVGVVAVVLLARKKLPREAGVALLLAAIFVSGYLFMDADWMGEYRFATGAILLSVLSAVTVFTAAVHAFTTPDLRAPTHPRVPAALTLVLAAIAIALSFPRIVAFAEKPTTPFADIRRSFARKLDAYADQLGVARGSVLLADVGAPLYDSRLTVYDAAGLCEPDVIRTLKQNKHIWLFRHPEFFDWVFERARPTFISTHHFWTLVTAFQEDPRFARDYVPIDAYEDAYVKRVYGRSMWSGDFVRRDALPDFSRLSALRSDYRPPPRPDPWVVRLREELFGRPPVIGEAAIESLREEAGRALHERDDPDRAATLFGRLLEQRPSDVQALFERASALDSAMRPEEARPEWQKLLLLSPDTPFGAAARARLSGLPP